MWTHFNCFIIRFVKYFIWLNKFEDGICIPTEASTFFVLLKGDWIHTNSCLSSVLETIYLAYKNILCVSIYFNIIIYGNSTYTYWEILLFLYYKSSFHWYSVEMTRSISILFYIFWLILCCHLIFLIQANFIRLFIVREAV